MPTSLSLKATVLDVSVQKFDRVLCGAGKRGSDVGLDPCDLTRLTGAVVADIRAL